MTDIIKLCETCNVHQGSILSSVDNLGNQEIRTAESDAPNNVGYMTTAVSGMVDLVDERFDNPTYY